MTTLRDLSYMIEANTEGLNKAFPALDKLVDSLERLTTTVQALNTNFGKAAKAAGDSTKAMGDEVVRSTNKIKDALEKQQAYMISATQRMESLKKAYKSAGQSTFAIQGTINAFEKLDKVSKDASATTAQIAIARAKFNTSLQKSQERLRDLNEQQREMVAVEKAAIGALEDLRKEQEAYQQSLDRTALASIDAAAKQEASLLRIESKMKGLNSALSATSGGAAFINKNVAAFSELEKVMRDSNATVGQVALAREKFNLVISESRQGLRDLIDMERAAEAASKRSAAASVQAANQQAQAQAQVAKQSQKQLDALTRNEGALIGAQQKTTGVVKAVGKTGADAKLADAATDAYSQLEKVLTDVDATSAQVTRAKAAFNARLVEVVRALKDYVEQSRTSNQVNKQNDTALLKQQNHLARLTIQYDNLSHSLEQMGAHPGRIKLLSDAFTEVSTALDSGVLDAKQLSEVLNKFNSQVAKVKRGEGFTTLNDRMSDLASTAQVALGPLSGVASRITAITTLANRNTIAIAALIGAFVGFTLSLGRAIMLGAEFEKQMAQIEAILKVTGNQIGLSIGEIESVVQRVAGSVRATETEVRDAAASLLTFRNVTKEVYEGALLAAQGLAIIARGDLNSQIRNIGRALDDPANNLTALTESGVSFNAMEMEQIKLLQLSGKLHEAQGKIMDRVQTVIAAAQGEVTGLAGAWKKLLQTFDNYLRLTGQGAALMQTFTNIVNMLSERFKQLSNNTAVTTGLMNGMWIAAKLLAGTVELLARHFDLLVGIVIAFTATRILSFMFGLKKAFDAYKKTLQVTALLQGLVTGGVKGLITMAVGILGIKLYEWHLDAAEGAETQAEALLGLDASLEKVKGTAEQLSKFRELTIRAQTVVDEGRVAKDKAASAAKALAEQSGIANSPHPGAGAAQAGINIGAMAGIKAPKLAQEDINTAMKMAETDVEKAIKFLEDKLNAVKGVIKGARAEMGREMAVALSDFVKLKDEHMPLIAAQQKLQAEMENVATKSKLMINALMRSGKTFQEASAMVELLTMQLEANGNQQQQYITNLRKQINTAQMDLKITRAVGSEKRALQTEQDELNGLYESGLISTADYTQELQKLDTLGFSPLVQRIRSLKKELGDLEFAKQVAEMTKSLEDQVRVMTRQAEVAGTSEYESAKAMAVLEQKIKMVNMGLSENHEAWQRSIDLVEQLTDLDFARQHKEAMRAMSDEASLQNVIADNMFKSERTRERAIALAEKQNELVAKYGSLTNANAQAELALFEAIQQRNSELQNLQEYADIIDDAFGSLEDTLVEAAKTGELSFEKMANSILEDIFRISFRQVISRPLQDALGGMLGGLTGGKDALSPLGNFSLTNPLPVYVTNSAFGGAVSGQPYTGADPWNTLRNVGDKVDYTGMGGGASDPVAAAKQKLIDDLIKQRNDYYDKFLSPFANEKLAIKMSARTDRELLSANPFSDMGLRTNLGRDTDLVKAASFAPTHRGGFTQGDSLFPSGAFFGGSSTTSGAGSLSESFLKNYKPTAADVKVMEGWIHESATKYGVDPAVATRLARFEGLKPGVWQSFAENRAGIREPSYGPFQMLKGGPGTGYGYGMGNAFEKAKGLSIEDPANTREAIDYAMKHASQKGWGEWMGRGPAGISEFEGIGRNTADAGIDTTITNSINKAEGSLNQLNDSATKLSGGFTGLTGNVEKFSDFDLDLKKFAGGRQSTNIEDLRNMGTMDWLKNEASVTKNTFFPQPEAPLNMNMPWSQALSNPNYNPGFQFDPSTFAGPTRDQFFKDIGWSTGGGTSMMGGAQPFMGGGFQSQFMGMPAPGAMPYSGFGSFQSGMSFGGDPTAALNGTVEKLNSSLTSLSDTVPSVTTSLSSGLNQATSAATSLADGGLNKAATSLSTFSDQALTSAITQQAQATTQTTTMGLAAGATSAQVTQLGAAASAASAQMATAGAGAGVSGVIGGVFHGGGIVGKGGGTAIMSGRGWAGAPRLHGGLRPDEFRAILKRDEGVFTADQMEAMGNAIDKNGNPTGGSNTGSLPGGNRSSGDTHIHLHGIKDFDSFKKSESQLRAGAAYMSQRAQARQG